MPQTVSFFEEMGAPKVSFFEVNGFYEGYLSLRKSLQ